MDTAELQRITHERKASRATWWRAWRAAAPDHAGAVVLFRARLARAGADELLLAYVPGADVAQVLTPDGQGGWTCGCSRLRQLADCAHVAAA